VTPIEQQRALMASIGIEGRILRDKNERHRSRYNTLGRNLVRSCQVQPDISR